MQEKFQERSRTKLSGRSMEESKCFNIGIKNNLTNRSNSVLDHMKFSSGDEGLSQGSYMMAFKP